MKGSTINSLESLLILLGFLGSCFGQKECPSMRIAKRVALEPPGEPNLARIRFGTDLNIIGNFLVVGAPGHTEDSGAAYIFQRATGVWSFKQRLTSRRRVVRDEFGYS
mmetsp:Transcript_14148/g.20583  ORF Transcript_14148/g.20583 Transcript_14148/m.20583 type:complete len:108 (-) Transcript_14148:834-1157(-)